MTIKTLESQIKEARRTISSDGYPMSIGELTNLYREGELIIRPEFQRFFRWTSTQKSNLIESILLGIPIPSIFVSQTESGAWELVDGLQRISTILELQGELLDEGKRLPSLTLQGTKYLSALEGKKWISDDTKSELSSAQKLDIKRSKIDLKIIKRESSKNTKFDLFQRLNSYGSSLNSQEMRSAYLVAVSPECFAWIESLAQYKNFVNCAQLSERLIDERYDLELVIRFLVLHNRKQDKISQNSLKDFPQLLDNESIAIAEKFPRNKVSLEKTFKQTFDILYNAASDNVFRKWSKSKKGFTGSFSITAFEVFALGLGYRIQNKLPYRTDIDNAIRELWTMKNMEAGYSTGRSTESRLAEFIPLGRELLTKP
ncbi:hypothetical protein NS274_09660 [Pseudomonas oryzihabitans]|nr:hypothetical protein NS274_09660 [Pseudomonas psychrotolerans]